MHPVADRSSPAAALRPAVESPLVCKLVELLSLDLRSLALMRIALAAVLLLDLADRARFLAAFTSDEGLLPRADALRISPLPLSLHLLGGSVAFEGALFAVAACFAVMMGVGWHTRIATVASWVLTTSLHARNFFLLLGGDDELRWMLLWSIFLPTGERMSLDARRRGGSPASAASTVLSGATVGVWIQLAVVYVFAALAKTSPEWRTEGTAIAYTLQRDTLVEPLGIWLRQRSPGLLRGMTLGTWRFELLGPLLFFSPLATGPLRCAAVLAFVYFHVSLGACLRLGIFPWVACAALTVALPSWFWERIGPRRKAAGTVPSRASIPAASGVPPMLSTLSNHVVPGLLAAYVLALNVNWLAPRPFLPSFVHTVAARLELDQNWVLFAPGPRHEDLSFEWWGILADGALHPDLLQLGRGPGWDTVRSLGSHARWGSYRDELARDRSASFRAPCAEWLCQSFNAGAAPESRLERLVWVVASRELRLDGASPEPRRQILMQYACPAGAEPGRELERTSALP